MHDLRGPLWTLARLQGHISPLARARSFSLHRHSRYDQLDLGHRTSSQYVSLRLAIPPRAHTPSLPAGFDRGAITETLDWTSRLYVAGILPYLFHNALGFGVLTGFLPWVIAELTESHDDFIRAAAFARAVTGYGELGVARLSGFTPLLIFNTPQALPYPSPSEQLPSSRPLLWLESLSVFSSSPSREEL